jgi:hypothetical protein
VRADPEPPANAPRRAAPAGPVAYLILSYKLPELVQRLVARLRAGSPSAIVAVHHDPRHSALGPLDAVRLPAAPVEWGRGSQLAAILRSLAWLRANTDFGWVVLLSGQDYPIRPVAEIEAGLRGADAFIEHVPVEPGQFAERYSNRWRPVSERVGPKLARVLPVRRFPSGLYVGLPARPPIPLYRGSDWCTLSRRAVDAVLDAPRPVIEHFLQTLVPTEAYFHSVLVASGLTLANEHRRYMPFAPGASNPQVLGFDDLDAVLASTADFARKFEDAAVLDEIDRRLTSARG